MSAAWVPVEEFKSIRLSWKAKGSKRFDFGSAAENLERSHRNQVAAAQEVSRLEALYQGLPPGDVRLTGGMVAGEEVPALGLLLRKARAEEQHWRGYVAHYRPLADAERAARAHDPRLPREPGDDDEEAA